MEIEESLVVIIVEKYEKANRFLVISKRSALSYKSFLSRFCQVVLYHLIYIKKMSNWFYLKIRKLNFCFGSHFG